MRLNRRPSVVVLLPSLLLTVSLTGLAGYAPPELPERLTDQQFWSLTESLSEPNGSFQSDNLLSNELVFARMVPDLVAQTKPGGVYLGVGPEQNFTYIAAIKPKIAFITDIRRGNLHMHLMYKALFELSKDRAEFVSRLFTKPRPDGLGPGSSVTDIMNAYWNVTTSDEATYNANLAAIHAHLTASHKLPLSAEDLAGVARVYRTFYWYGPAMTYAANTSLTLLANRGTTYSDLMTQGDTNGQGLSYLGSEEKFLFLKELQRRNLVVPVVGDFAGPKALRAVGAYVRDHGATVTAFYLSNVEQYLRRANTWQAFCSNVATFPIDDASVLIRPSGGTFNLINGPLASPTTGQPVVVSGGTATVGGRVAEIRMVFGTPGGTSALAGGLVPIAAEVKSCGG